MSKTKVLNLCSLVLNLIIVGLVAYGAVYINIANGLFVASLNYYTMLSNLFAGLTALITVVASIVCFVKDKKLPKFVFVLGLIMAINLAITMLTVLCYLGPVVFKDYATLLGLANPLQDTQFFMHLLIPVFAILVFIFTSIHEKVKLPGAFFGLVGIGAYGIFYVLNVFLKFIEVKVAVQGGVTTADWYFFFFKGTGLGFGIFAGILVVALLLALLFWLANGALNKAYFKNAAVPANEYSGNYSSSTVKEEKAEEAPAVEEKKPEPEPAEVEEEKEEPIVEEVPAEEIKEEKPVEEKVSKPAPKKEAAKPAKKEEKKPEAKVAPKKEEKKPEAKPAEKKAPAKAESKKEAAKPAAKKEAAKPAANKEGQTKVYHLTKRKEDGMWAITFVGGQKAVKLFKTKKEAEAALAVLTENQGATALIRNSKGAKAGKFASSIKSDKE